MQEKNQQHIPVFSEISKEATTGTRVGRGIGVRVGLCMDSHVSKKPKAPPPPQRRTELKKTSRSKRRDSEMSLASINVCEIDLYRSL